MASVYPGSLDSLTNPLPTDSQLTVSHADQHADANDAIEAIQATLGVNPQDSYVNVAARLATLDGSLVGQVASATASANTAAASAAAALVSEGNADASELAAAAHAAAADLSKVNAASSAVTAGLARDDAVAARNAAQVAEAAALASQGDALVSEVNAASSASDANASKVAAAASEASAAASAATATSQASVATVEAGIASAQAATATSQAGTATSQAGVATTKASEAAASAVTATTKASEAASSASAAAVSASDAAATLASRAPLASPALTGTPTVPTAAVDTNTTQAASTAFVLGQAASTNPAMNGSVAVGSSTRYARADHVHASDTSRAPLASPTFTGTVSLPSDVRGWASNLLTVNQASVETDLTGWNTTGASYFCNTTGATITRDTSQASVGLASVKVVTDGTLAYQGFYGTFSGLLPNTTYTAYCRFKRTGSGSGAQLNIRDQTALANYQSSVVTSSSWTPVYVTFRTGASSTTVTLNFTAGESGRAAETFYVDAMGLWEGAGGEWALPGRPVVNLGTYTDESVGRRIFTWDTVNSRWQMTYGDTGWRDISGTVTWLATHYDSGTATSLYARRQGSIVTMLGFWRVPNPAPAADGNIVTSIPSGFRPSASMIAYQGLLVNASSNGGAFQGQYSIANAGTINTRGLVAANLASVSATYATNDSWPTSLPGTAVGSIPQ